MFYYDREAIVEYVDLKQGYSNSCQVSLLFYLSWLMNDTDKTQIQIFTFVVIQNTSGHGVLINTAFCPT